MATGTQAEQREALKAQLQAEMEAQLATYEAEAKANAEKQKAGYQKNIDDANNSYTAYETQTNASMAKSIEDMLKQYNNDSVRRGMARSTYALDRGTEGESSIRQEVARALAAQKATTDSGVRNYQDLINLIASQTDANIAAQKQAAQKTINSNLSNFDLSFLQQQQDLENQKELLTFQNNLKSSGGGSGGRSGGSGAGVNPYAAALTSTGMHIATFFRRGARNMRPPMTHRQNWTT